METKVILNVPTLTLAHGRDIGGDLKDVNVLFLVIPGNPGILEFYRDFMDELSFDLKIKFPDEVIPVWGIGHAGHGGTTQPIPSLSSSPDSYSLEGQIKHKEAFIKEFIPSHVKLILIGHSIGCHISLQLLKRELEISSQVIQVLLLFPTIMDMKGSPNGQWFTSPIIRSLQWVPTTILYPMDFAPACVHRFLARVYTFFRQCHSDCVQEGIVTLLNRSVLQKVICMANYEMDQVTTLDVATLEQNSARLYAYFGASDGWCPLKFVGHITSQVPKLPHHVCTEGIEHAFVLEASRRVAGIVMSQVRSLLDPLVGAHPN